MARTSRTRSSNGTGSIRRLKSGRWEGTIMLGWGPDGKRNRRTATHDRKTEVADAMRKLWVRYQDGTYTETANWTFGQLAERCLEQREAELKPTTYQAYRYAASRLAPLHATRLRDLTLLHVDDLRVSLTKDGLAPSYIHRILATLKAMLKFAVKRGLLHAPWIDDIALPAIPRPNPTAYDAEQVRQILTVAQGTPLYALIVVALTTGLRRGELLALRWDDIEFPDAGGVRIHVRHNVVQPGKTLMVQEPKTENSRRTVRGGCLTERVLRDHRASQRQAFGRDTGDEVAVVFANEVGGYLNTWRIYQPLKAVTKAAGVPYDGLHMFRRTNASLLIEQGVDDKAVSEHLGHASVAFTRMHYQHVFKSQRESAILDFDQLPPADRVAN